MEIEHFQAMYEMEDTYWWYVGMRGIFLSLIDRHYQERRNLRILDAGCGTGGNLGHLRRYGQVTGIDISSEAIRFCWLRDWKGCRLVQSSLKSLPFHDEVFDLITSFDVLCYIDDDMLAMHELSRVLKPGGRLIVNLPAYGLLHSKHDLAVHVEKRYTRLQVAQMMEKAGLTVEKITYANSVLFPLEAAVRIARKWPASSASQAESDLRILPPIINRWLTMVLYFERNLLQRLNLPFGLSVISVGRKSG
jgi:SAM-dependent methyltransferase